MSTGVARSTLGSYADDARPQQAVDATRQAAALRAALEELGVPAFVLDATCAIRETNREARAQLAREGEETAAALRRATRAEDAEPEFELVPLEQAGRHLGWLALARQSAEKSAAAREQKLAHVAARWRLTRRQAQVLELLAVGASNGLIAARLGISERTVEDHVSAVRQRAGVVSRAELLAVLLQ